MEDATCQQDIEKLDAFIKASTNHHISSARAVTLPFIERLEVVAKQAPDTLRKLTKDYLRDAAADVAYRYNRDPYMLHEVPEELEQDVKDLLAFVNPALTQDVAAINAFRAVVREWAQALEELFARDRAEMEQRKP